MCGGKMGICHTMGLGISCKFLWHFSRLRGQANLSETYYQLLPLSFCANFGLFVSIILVLPFFIFCFGNGLVNYDIICPVVEKVTSVLFGDQPGQTLFTKILFWVRFLCAFCFVSLALFMLVFILLMISSIAF
jgi:hypothetical protein